MSSLGFPALQQLHRLDRSSSEFPDQLTNVLYGDEYQQCAPNLQGDDSVWLVEYLDKALDDLDPSSPAFRKCLRELRTVCGTSGILPTSYALPSDLLIIGPEPFASGGYGDVYEGLLDGSRVCIKRVRVYIQDGLHKATKAFCQEAIMWRHLTHPNIVPLLGVTITPKFQLVSDWMSGGDLPEHLKKNPDADRLKLLSDVAKGLCYLHSCNVIHGDLKGSNILMDNSGSARLADFGLAMVTLNLDSVRSATSQRGFTPRWAAPEILDEGTYSKGADVFSFAMVMIEVFTGAIPFIGNTISMAILAITQGRHPPRPTHPTFTENLWTLMQRCWDKDPHLRPEVSEALQVLLTPEDPAWKQLINHSLDTEERVSLITKIFMDRNQVEMIRQLSRNDAQNFIDRVDGALDDLAPEIRGRCVRYLHKICGRQALLPQSLAIPLCYDPMENPQCNGMVVNVWKGEYQGREVAAEVLKYPRGDFGELRRNFSREVVAWRTLRHPNVLPLLGVTMTETRLVMVSEWMVNDNIMKFTKANVNVDRLGLLRDITRGLIYMHDQGMIHGDLRGTHILVDSKGHACLTGFSLLTMAPSQSTDTSSWTEGGVTRWMSPELFDPGRFGLEKARRTKGSDCYALGMVMYEVLSGQAPFTPYREPGIMLMVLEGYRPERPQGDEGKLFADAIWGILGLCWKHIPEERTSAKVVLACLEGTWSPPQPSSDTSGVVESDTGLPDATASDTAGHTTARSNHSPLISQQSLPGQTSSVAPLDEDKPPAQPQKGSSKKGRISEFVRNARKRFKAIT